VREFLNDLRFSFRSLFNRSGFAALAIACLSLGIGANTAVFSLLNALLLQGLPFHKANQLVLVHRGTNLRFSFPEYSAIKSRFQNSGTVLATFVTESSLDRAGRQGQLITGEAVTGNYARVLEARTVLGDWFDNEDSPVAVISYRAWQDLFHGDPTALGQEVRSETQWYTVIGVAPKDFNGLTLPKSTSIWVPLHIWMRQHRAIQFQLESWNSPVVGLVARLSPAVTYSQATAQLRIIQTELDREHRGLNNAQPIAAEPVRGVTDSSDRGIVKRIISLLFGVVGILLVICCVNVGNLLLARGASRQREIDIRYALGATRWRIIMQLLAEALLLAAFGAAGGLLTSVLLVQLILKLLPALPLGEAINANVPVDARVLIFVAASAVATVFLFGLVPALKTSSNGPSSQTRGSLGTLSGVRLRKSSVVVQVALSFVLLVVAALSLETCWRLQLVDPGFQTRDRLYATTYISKPEFNADQFAGFYQRLVADLRSTPGIKSAGLTYLLPLNLPQPECVKAPDFGRFDATSSTIGPGFLHTLGILILQGRDFAVTDNAMFPNVVLVNKAFADKVWPNTIAVGRQIQLGCSEASNAVIVGVVADSRSVSLSQAPGPHIYSHFAQHATGLANIIVEASGMSGGVVDQLRRVLLNEGHGIRVYAVNSLEEHVEDSYWELRWEAWLLAGFGVTALLLAALGLYGVVSYGTTLRIKEFGIRLAVGARTSDILQVVMEEGLATSLIGIGLGVCGAHAASKFLRNYLLEGQSFLLPACLGVGVIWLVIVAAACYAPARRSSQVDPSVTLRYD
jgi:putative ABC transport system permease protein